tara:strand:- start:5734 stop:6753 length:1020 start_codon:yes stop_codon:yes gene_type:complete
MEFFNQKEEVIDIQLTQYGKRLLAKGHFKPSFYAFFDKDVMYNSEWAGISEQQNSTETRIKDETPRMKVQHNYIGVETQFHEMKNIIQFKEDFSDSFIEDALQDADNTFFAVTDAIGTTKLESKYKPSWDIKFYNESLTSAVSTFSGSGPIIRIPQIEATNKFSFFATDNIQDSGLTEETDLVFAPNETDKQVFDFIDGSTILIEKGFLLLGIEEKNTHYETENFEIEIFQVEEYYPNQKLENAGEIKEKLIPLKFFSQEKYEQAGNIVGMDIYKNPQFVEYFFDVMVDEEIPADILCNKVFEDDKKSLYVREIFQCPDKNTAAPGNDIYEDDELGDAC